ncbi:MAG: LPS export ABC transporter periplasmic protein LptC [Pseudomonadota bacterium]
MKKRLSIPLLVCAAAVVAVLFADPPKIVQPPPELSLDEEAPDSYASNVTIATFDKTGSVVAATEASRMVRSMPSSQSAQVRLFGIRRTDRQDSGIWLSSADSGVFYEARNALRLDERVKIESQDGNLLFSTEAALMNFQGKWARSLSPATLVKLDKSSSVSESLIESARLEGNELFIDFTKQTASLTGRVTSRYAP